MNAQCIIWTDKELNFSGAPESFCIFALYITDAVSVLIKSAI
jgi:hypothetical protein